MLVTIGIAEKRAIGNTVVKAWLLMLSVAISTDCIADMLVSDSSPVVQNARLLYSGRKDYAQYDLIAGKMDYIEDASSEGFKPKRVQPIVGTIDRRLYDYAKQKSAIEIYGRVVASLERGKYRIVFQCSGVGCGGAAGWQLFLSKQLGGDDLNQHYVAAVKDDSLRRSHYFIFYVNDLAGQPRALVDSVIVSPPAPTIVARGKEASADQDSVQVGSSIYFEFGKAELDNRAEQLSRAKNFVTENGAHCPIRVIGYTDPVGTEAANQLLAKARVEEVIKYLQGNTELSLNCLIAEPRGIEVASGADDLAASRRVDLVIAAKN